MIKKLSTKSVLNEKDSSTLLLLGSGSLIQELVVALSSYRLKNNKKLTVFIASRNAKRISWLKYLGNSRAYSLGTNVVFSARHIDLNNAEQLTEFLLKESPDVILLGASYQSVWELSEKNAWSELVRKSGYGITAPLQGVLLSVLNRALILSENKSSKVINACYPDLINCAAAGTRVSPVCGIGNVALIAENFRQYLKCKKADKLQVIAGHWDVAQATQDFLERKNLPLVWLNNKPLHENLILNAPSLANDQSLNAFNASLSSKLILTIVGKETGDFHAPGPENLLGGYPIHVKQGEVYLDLPDNAEIDKIKKWNFKRSELDGAVVEEGKITFSDEGEKLLKTIDPKLKTAFEFSEMEDLAEEFVKLKKYLKLKNHLKSVFKGGRNFHLA